jgi:hypothetical protein
MSHAKSPRRKVKKYLPWRALRLGGRYSTLWRKKVTENEIAKLIVDAAYKIHSTLGPGLLESAYQTILVYELQNRGMSVEAEKQIPIAKATSHLLAACRHAFGASDKFRRTDHKIRNHSGRQWAGRIIENPDVFLAWCKKFPKNLALPLTLGEPGLVKI